MKKFLIAGAFALVSAQTVYAADMPVKAVHAATYNWSGFYVGGNIGYGWARSSDSFSFVTGPGAVIDLGSSSANVNGVIGGLQAGYNWQRGSLVLGIETDIQASGQSGSATAAGPAGFCGPGCNVTSTNKLTWFGTTRARVGTAFDQWLVYGTAGVAYGTVKVDTVQNVPFGGPFAAPLTGSKTRVGWTVGAGVERAVTANWSWRLEYLYLDLGTYSFSQAVPTPPFIVGTINQSARIRDNIVRVGANYRF